MIRILEYFPVIIMLESLFAALIYAYIGDWYKVLYWGCSFGIVFSVLRLH